MLKLIINADDLGYSPGVNRGIIMTQKSGVVTSTTLLMNRQATSLAIADITEGLVSNVGVHFCLSGGRALTEPELIPTLVTQVGKFIEPQLMLKETLSKIQVEQELRAQLNKALAAGVRVTHLDCHHHVHLHETVLLAIVEIAREHNLPIRSVNSDMRQFLQRQNIKTADYFIGEFYGEGATQENLIRLLKQAKELLLVSSKRESTANIKVVELMVHPGIVDQYLQANSSYTCGREKELKVLVAEETSWEIKRMGYELISFKEI